MSNWYGVAITVGIILTAVLTFLVIALVEREEEAKARRINAEKRWPGKT